jgi:hypothetical protein
MVECHNCAEEVQEVWRVRVFSGTTTHREIAWVCRECHPSIATTSRTVTDRPATGTTDEPTAIADGGMPTLGCPMCGGSTIDGQGLSACTECSWTGRR